MLAAIILAGCGDQFERDQPRLTPGRDAATQATTPTTATATTPKVAPRRHSPSELAREGARKSPSVSAGGEGSELLTGAPAQTVRAAIPVARRFLAGYLPYSYARGSAAAIHGAAPALRAELASKPARIPPGIRARFKPRLLSVTVSGTYNTDAFVLATVDDGTERYGLTLRLHPTGKSYVVDQVT